MQMFKLQAYIEKRNSCAHQYRSFAVWHRAKETTIMAARTDFTEWIFVTEVLIDA